jgi:hypothetical protein
MRRLACHDHFAMALPEGIGLLVGSLLPANSFHARGIHQSDNLLF